MRHFIEAIDTRRFFTEDYSFPIRERTIEAALAVLPGTCAAFRFYDLVDVVDQPVPAVDGVVFRMTYDRLNVSGWHYPQGEIFSLDRIARLAQDDPNTYRILHSNMVSNNWTRVVRHRSGGFRPYSYGTDAVV